MAKNNFTDYAGYCDYYTSNNFIAHFGILGMKWGVRRYQNPDGSLTPEGQRRYKQLDDGSYQKLSKEERKQIKQKEMREFAYAQLVKMETKQRAEEIQDVLRNDADNKVSIHYEDDNTSGISQQKLQNFMENNADLREQIADLIRNNNKLSFWDETTENACSNLNLTDEQKVEYFIKSIGQKTNDLYVNNDGTYDWELDDNMLYGGHNFLVELNKDLDKIERILS